MATLELVLRDYLRSRTSVMALLNNDDRRLNLEWTGDARATRVTLYRTGGYQLDYVPLDNALFRILCYGTARPVAAELADTIAAEMRGMYAQPDSMLRSASIESLNWLPTPDGAACYVVTTTVVAAITGPLAA